MVTEHREAEHRYEADPAVLTLPRPLTGKSTAGEVVLGYLRKQASVMKELDPLVRRGEPDSVHKMRIAARRVRSTLQSFPTIVQASGTRHLTGELHWLGGLLGTSRDAEILSGRLARHLRRTSPELIMGPVAARLRIHFAPREAAAAQAVAEALDSERYAALLGGLGRLLADPPLTAAAQRPAAEELPKAVAHTYRRTASGCAGRWWHRPGGGRRAPCIRHANRPSGPATPRRCCARCPAHRPAGSPGR